ncbi:hypothetical protein [Flammeovirga pacifica]|uniref:DUF695 domain-containing protein n=1 Tax=Flammeovirga pacifica TaxID=915059 RepID=A0A1S1YSG3_FLAPC|nr:hypothetical protein [Flammeovirga pacifica]OHX63960.1 hypothetical protein NH26_20330 [Flammeovirga pacifica]
MTSNFWNWFKQNHYKYLFLNDIDEEQKEELLDEFLNELHKFSENLFFEIGGHPNDEKVELVITATGFTEYFPQVEQLIDNAPNMQEWKFIKYKQPQGPGFTTEYQGYKFDPDRTIFVPLTNKNDPDDIGIRVFYSDYEDDKNDIFMNGTYIMLDTLIGEKSTALDIDYLDVKSTPNNISEYNFMHLGEIGEYIKERKTKSNNG